ncbi:lysylphosphatidylglycerol synthase transmembrane domain-containing protein [Tropicimonas aquimaris]|uniref:Lysylphosphatidylglycerol synthase transmembrane domain-containing protein n=1 Tax=Tropicimonas aquimaris TaxID=914152 RepID=A0ABW3IY94_9RHOB
MGRAIKVGLGLAVTVLFLWLVLRQVSLDEVGAVISGADRGMIAIATGVFLLGYACRIQRWRLMLAHENPGLGWGRTAVPFMSSIAVNNLVPLRAGDALRAFGFTDWLQAPASAVLATVLAERLLDLLVLMVGLGLVLAFLPAASELSVLMGLGSTGIALAVAAILLVLLFPRTFQPMFLMLLRWCARLLPGLGGRLTHAAEKIFDTLNHLAGRPMMLRLLAWSCLAWGFEAAVFYCVALSIAELRDPLAGLVAMPVGTLSTLVPSSPGYVGTFDFFVGKTVELLGNPFSVGAAFAVTVHLVLWLAATLTGGVCLLAWITQRGRSAAPLQKGSPHV